jgi:hypothetical protein
MLPLVEGKAKAKVIFPPDMIKATLLARWTIQIRWTNYREVQSES